MSSLIIRPLRADEIEVRIGIEKRKDPKDKKSDAIGGSLLLYKDARCDMRILDELFTPWGWQREHKELKGTIYCGVSIKHDNEWVTKWDAGSESDVEKEKGEASDSFKRACFNWGIGIELYTAPFIWIDYNEDEIGRTKRFYVREIEVSEDKRITRITIVDGKGNIRYSYPKQYTTPKPQPQTPQQPSQQPKARPSDVLDKVHAAETTKELTEIWESHLDIIKENDKLRESFTKRKNEILARQAEQKQSEQPTQTNQQA